MEVGAVLSSLYVPFHVAVFHTRSLAHRYNVCDDSVVLLIWLPLEYAVPFRQSELSRLYFATFKYESLPLKVIVISELYRLALLLVAATIGTTLSYVVLIVLDAVFPFHAVSVATDDNTCVLTVHCHDGVTVHLYTVLLTAVNALILQLVTVTSHHVNVVVASLNVHVTTKLVQLKYVHTSQVNVTVGAVTSILIGLVDARVA